LSLISINKKLNGDKTIDWFDSQTKAIIPKFIQFKNFKDNFKRNIYIDWKQWYS
jgi:hypothetical protein